MIQWFRCYEVVSIYRKGWQEQDFDQKQHFESIQLMSESIQTVKRQGRLVYEDWIDSDRIWIDSKIPGWRLIRIRQNLNRFKNPQKKIESIQINFNLSKQSQRRIWIDSNKSESIHCDASHKNLNRFNQS